MELTHDGEDWEVKAQTMFEGVLCDYVVCKHCGMTGYRPVES